MASSSDSSLSFFSKANSHQWSYVLSLYKDVLKERAHQTRGSKKGGPQELIKLDNWYQEQLPKIIQSRKDRFIVHDELIQITKWKLWRGKNRARLLDLVRINTETSVLQTSKKAFKKLPNLSAAIQALTNLKGIGPATASAVLAAGAPEHCPYMADESMLATPGIEATDYTVAEYLNFSEQIINCCEKLKEQDPNGKWNPHKVELALWTHYWIKEMKLNLLDGMPCEGKERHEDEKTLDMNKNNESVGTNGKSSEKVLDEDSNISVPVSNASCEEKSNDSCVDNEDGRCDGNGNSLNSLEDSVDGIASVRYENAEESGEGVRKGVVGNLVISSEWSNNCESNSYSCDGVENSQEPEIRKLEGKEEGEPQMKKARFENE